MFTFSSADDKARLISAVLHQRIAATALCTATATRASPDLPASDTNPSISLSPAFGTLVFLLIQVQM